MTTEEKAALLSQIDGIKENFTEFSLSEEKMRLETLGIQLEKLKKNLEETSITPIFLSKEAEHILPTSSAIQSHSGYQTSNDCLEMEDAANPGKKKLKGFYLDTTQLPLFNDPTGQNLAQKYFLMFGKKPDVDESGNPTSNPPTFKNPYFTLLVLGIDNQQQLLKDNNGPIVYEYLTPHTIPRGKKCTGCLKEIDDIFS